MSDVERALGELDGAGSVLVLAPSLDTPDDEACIGLLTATDPAAANVLSVTLTATPEDRLALWHRQVGETLPKRTAILGADGSTTEGDTLDEGAATVVALSDPVDPLEFVSAVSGYVGRWEDTPEPTFVCIHSLTALFDRLEESEVTRLVAVLNARFGAAGAVAHYHLDSTAHDDRLLAAVRPLFDAVAEYHPEPGWTVSRTGHAGDPGDDSIGTRPGLKTDREGIDPPAPSRSLDAAIDLLAAARRRAVLYLFVSGDENRVGLETLVAEVHALSEDGEADSRDAVETALLHVHLPKLADAGIIEFDRDAGTVEYVPNPTLEACTRRLLAMETA